VNKGTIIEIFSRFQQKQSSPLIELDYINHYTLLVAVVLSAQSTDKGVNRVTPALFAIADTPEKMLALGEERLKYMIKTIGLYNNKASNIIKLSQKLLDHFDSIVPEDFDALCSLPGVGSKSANVVLNSAFGHPTIAVDTHVFRVSNRVGICKSKTPKQTEKLLKSKVPKEFASHAHHWLVLHGRYVCVARKPKCDSCIINDLCQFPNKTV
jgi:endonuclease-3